MVASLNVNSLLLHIDEIRATVKELGIHILAINETKLDGHIADELVDIDGFSINPIWTGGGAKLAPPPGFFYVTFFR